MQPKHFYVLFIAAIASLIVTGCQRTVPVTIVGKWTMQTAIGNYTVQGINHKDTTTYGAPSYFEFKSDSTLGISEPTGMHAGRWKIVNNKLYITGTNYIDYAAGFDLPILTNTDLQLYYTETTNVAFLEQKLNFTR